MQVKIMVVCLRSLATNEILIVAVADNNLGLCIIDRPTGQDNE